MNLIKTQKLRTTLKAPVLILSSQIAGQIGNHKTPTNRIVRGLQDATAHFGKSISRFNEILFLLPSVLSDRKSLVYNFLRKHRRDLHISFAHDININSCEVSVFGSQLNPHLCKTLDVARRRSVFKLSVIFRNNPHSRNDDIVLNNPHTPLQRLNASLLNKQTLDSPNAESFQTQDVNNFLFSFLYSDYLNFISPQSRPGVFVVTTTGDIFDKYLKAFLIRRYQNNIAIIKSLATGKAESLSTKPEAAILFCADDQQTFNLIASITKTKNKRLSIGHYWLLTKTSRSSSPLPDSVVWISEQDWDPKEKSLSAFWLFQMLSQQKLRISGSYLKHIITVNPFQPYLAGYSGADIVEAVRLSKTMANSIDTQKYWYWSEYFAQLLVDAHARCVDNEQRLESAAFQRDLSDLLSNSLGVSSFRTLDKKENENTVEPDNQMRVTASSRKVKKHAKRDLDKARSRVHKNTLSAHIPKDDETADSNPAAPKQSGKTISVESRSVIFSSDVPKPLEGRSPVTSQTDTASSTVFQVEQLIIHALNVSMPAESTKIDANQVTISSESTMVSAQQASIPAEKIQLGIDRATPPAEFNNIDRIDKSEALSISRDISQQTEITINLPAYGLYKTGTEWELVFQGIPYHFTETVAIKYILFLLKHQGEQIPALQLVRWLHPADTLARSPRDLGLDENVGQEEDEPAGDVGIEIAGKIIGEEVIQTWSYAKFRKIVKYFELAIEEAEDPIEKHELQQKLATCKSIRASEVNRYGRPRRIGDAENARRSVQKNIGSFVKRIVDSPVLYEHFEASLKTGQSCSYSPATHIDWVFQRQ